MQSSQNSAAFEEAEYPLPSDALVALKMACAPTAIVGFPALGIIRVLRQLGYVEIVIGGLVATESGLERLIRERNRQAGRQTIK